MEEKRSSNLTISIRVELANADVGNEFIQHNKISENADYFFQNVRQCTITGSLRDTAFQSCRVMQSPGSTV